MEISITVIIIAITCVVSFIAFTNHNLLDQFIFYPPAVRRGQVYRFFSCGLIHADWGHLIFNMIALYFFGEGKVTTPEGYVIYNGLEFQFVKVFGQSGKLVYVLLYVLALAASVIPTYFKNKDNYHYRSLGASGAVSAVIFGGVMFKPLDGIGLFFIPVYISGFIFAIIYLLVSNWLDKRGGDNINHSAHIFGALFGIGFTIIACQTFGNYNLLQEFVFQIQNMDPSKIIQFGDK